MTNREYLLMALLDCGTCDLGMIDDVGYDWRDILTYNITQCGRDFPASLDTLLDYVVDYGVDKLQTAISDRICELEAIPNERELNDEENEELHSLCILNPDDDIGRCFNCLDTHIWFANNGDIYQKYLADELDLFESGTSFYIE